MTLIVYGLGFEVERGLYIVIWTSYGWKVGAKYVTSLLNPGQTYPSICKFSGHHSPNPFSLFIFKGLEEGKVQCQALCKLTGI
jgi:hypothetical protein